MKKWIRMTALALAALLALAGCGKKQEPAGDRLAQIQQKGELVIALEGNWAPWSFHDDSDALVGYDVEVGKAIAEKLGVKATFVEGEWDGLLAGVEAGRYDMVINGVDITDSRKETYDFSTPYAYIKTALVVAVGCTGGHHRSVAVAHALADLVRRAGFPVSESHRDLGRN